MESREVKVGKFNLSSGKAAFIIAEIGINHNGSLELAKKLVDAAKEAGADCAKFQKRDLNSLYTAEFIEDPNRDSQGLLNLINTLKEVELSESDYHALLAYCQEKGILFLCTPFDEKSVDFLETLGVQAYKIGSPDLTNMPLLALIIRTKKPMLVSTGMSTEEELDFTVEFLKKNGAAFILNHCNNTYPSPLFNINLSYMPKLREKYGVPIGYSGHERGTLIPVAARAMGAMVIEKHLTLDRGMKGPDHVSSLEPEEFKKMVKDIRDLETAFGNGKKSITRGEILVRETLSKGLYAKADIKKGEKITAAKIQVAGPWKGLSPQAIGKLTATIAKREIKKGDLFVEEDL